MRPEPHPKIKRLIEIYGKKADKIYGRNALTAQELKMTFIKENLKRHAFGIAGKRALQAAGFNFRNRSEMPAVKKIIRKLKEIAELEIFLKHESPLTNDRIKRAWGELRDIVSKAKNDEGLTHFIQAFKSEMNVLGHGSGYSALLEKPQLC